MPVNLQDAKAAAVAKPREVHILVIDREEALLSALWHALDSDGWQMRSASEASQVLPALASQDWTVVIADVTVVGLSGPLFDTLKEVAQAPAVEGGHSRARVLFLVPEESALEARAVLEIAQLPYTAKPINLHDLLEKVSDLMLEAQALSQPIRRVRDLGQRQRQTRNPLKTHQQAPTMLAAREDYLFTDEELAEFEAQEAALKAGSKIRKRNPRDLGNPLTQA